MIINLLGIRELCKSANNAVRIKEDKNTGYVIRKLIVSTPVSIGMTI